MLSVSTQCDQCVVLREAAGFFHARLTSRPNIRLKKESSRHQQQLAVAMLLVLLFGRLSPALVGRSLPRWPVGMQPGSGRGLAPAWATCAARAVCCCLIALSLLQISSRAGRPLANANGVGGREGGAAVRPARAAAPRSASYSYTFDFLSRLPPPCVPSSATHGSRPTFQTPFGPDAIRPSRWSNSP